jgi:hypothetical protein
MADSARPKVWMVLRDGLETFAINHVKYRTFFRDPEKANRDGYVGTEIINFFDEAGTRSELVKLMGLSGDEIDALITQARRDAVSDR